MSENTRFYFKPAQGEQIETRIKIGQNNKSSIYATVLDCDDKPVKGAVALLFRVLEEAEPEMRETELISNTHTDDDGQFVFGNLEGNVLYLIKIFFNKCKIRELEIKM